MVSVYRISCRFAVGLQHIFLACGEFPTKKRPTRVGLEMKMELPYSAAGISAAGCAEGSSAAGAAGIAVAGICAGA